MSPIAAQEAGACAGATTAGDLTAARRHCELGLEYAPDSSELLTDLGVIDYLEGKVAEAKALFIRSIHSNANARQAYNDLGILALDQGDFGTAASRFRGALKVDPAFLNARLGLGIALFRARDLAGSKDAFGLLVTSHPESPEGFRWLGFLALQENDAAEAARQFTVATHLDPNDAVAWLDLGVALARLARVGEAADAFRACLDADERHLECRGALKLLDEHQTDIAAQPPTSLRPGVHDNASGEHEPDGRRSP